MNGVLTPIRLLPASPVLRWLTAAGLTVAAAASLAAADPAAGKVLHDRQCVACHATRFGGDGAQIYLRPNRLIHDRKALRQRVAMCASQTDAGWFPEDEENVTAYLAERYYKFR